MPAKLAAIGVVLLVGVAAAFPRVALAKGPDFYAPLTIGLVGLGGVRSFDASGGMDGQAAWELVQQIQISAAGNSSPRPAPNLHDYYEITFHQGSATPNRLPWYGTPTSQFFFYPGTGSTPDHLRLHMARISEPLRDTWLLAMPSLSAMLGRHVQGLAPVRGTHPAGSVSWLSLGLIPPLVLGALWVFRRRSPRWSTSWAG
ncbi:MAG: hypothetical protein ACYDGR_15800 [Candidatus Dormibacteria bacterium]